MKITNCRICKESIQKFMSFGKMPIANAFSKEKIINEYRFELSPAFCTSCYTFQLIEQPDLKKMFHSEYVFFSRQSKFMQNHFKNYTEWLLENYSQGKDNFVIEIGCNDGIMLENFYKRGIKHLGIDPSANVVKVAKSFGVNAQVNFFGTDVANKIINDYGRCSAIISANLMCHVPDLEDIAKGAFNLLNEKGVLVFEDPYLGSMFDKISYDQIYDEHVYIFSAISTQKIFGNYGFELINLIPQETHGGSMRYVFAKKGAHKINSKVNEIIKNELNRGFDKQHIYNKFKNDCELSKLRFRKILMKAKADGKSIAGYGATSKSTTILNYCEIGADIIDFISDTTPIKKNTYSPGMCIPVKSYEFFKNNIPDVIILFAWNHAKEIIEKEKKFIEKKVEWITHLPFFEIKL